MIFVDSNVLIDIFGKDQAWRERSAALVLSLNTAGEELVINPIVVAELAGNFPNVQALLQAVDRLDIEVLPLNDEIAFAAGQAFRSYRRGQKDRTGILADFLIGAHARHLSARLLTRDLTLYSRHFPDLETLTPETDNG
jgi:hypothetical protein